MSGTVSIFICPAAVETCLSQLNNYFIPTTNLSAKGRATREFNLNWTFENYKYPEQTCLRGSYPEQQVSPCVFGLVFSLSFIFSFRSTLCRASNKHWGIRFNLTCKKGYKNEEIQKMMKSDTVGRTKGKIGWNAIPSYRSTRSLSPAASPIGASQLMLSSVLLTLVIRTLLTRLGTLASVVTVMSTYSDLPAKGDTPFSANTWKRYVVTAFNPVIVIFVSLKISWNTTMAHLSESYLWHMSSCSVSLNF